MRKQSGLYRFISAAADKVEAEIIIIDLGLNLGPMNRTVLSCCDYFIVPVAPDLFSIRGTENPGKKLDIWRAGWEQINQAAPDETIELPLGKPKFLGYVTQQHNMRNNPDGMTRGWKIFGSRVEAAIEANIVERLRPHGQTVDWEDDSYNLGRIPNLHSLVPYSQEARKPIFDCTSADGLQGAHIQRAVNSYQLYEPMADILIGLLG